MEEAPKNKNKVNGREYESEWITDHIDQYMNARVIYTSFINCAGAAGAAATVVVVVVLTLTHRYNAVRGHRTGSNNSGPENYLRRKTNKNRR